MVTIAAVALAACGQAHETGYTSLSGAEQNGLVVTLKPTKASFTLSEPLEFKLGYRNVSTEAFRLPDQPALYNFWLLRLEEAKTHRVYTGGTLLPMGGAVIGTPSAAIQPGETLTTTVVFKQYGFVEGTLDYPAFQKVKLQSALAARGTSQLSTGDYLSSVQPGNYKATVLVRFPLSVRVDADPTPIWQGKEIMTTQAQVRLNG